MASRTLPRLLSSSESRKDPSRPFPPLRAIVTPPRYGSAAPYLDHLAEVKDAQEVKKVQLDWLRVQLLEPEEWNVHSASGDNWQAMASMKFIEDGGDKETSTKVPRSKAQFGSHRQLALRPSPLRVPVSPRELFALDRTFFPFLDVPPASSVLPELKEIRVHDALKKTAAKETFKEILLENSGGSADRSRPHAPPLLKRETCSKQLRVSLMS